MKMNLRASSVLLASACAAGCAMIDPYPTSQAYGAHKAHHGPIPAGMSDSGTDEWFDCPNVSTGKKKALCERFVYESRLRQLGYANSLNAIGLLALGATVAYRGPNVPSSKKNVQALTYGGTAWYAGYTYLYKKPREAIYASGMLALDCASEQASPWIEAKDPQLAGPLQRLNQSVNLMRSRVGAAQTASIAVASERDALSCKTKATSVVRQAIDDLDVRLRETAAQLDADQTDLDHGKRYDMDYIRNHEQADRNLKFAVDAIHNEVLDQLQKLEPEPSALAASLGPFVPAAKSPAPAKPKSTSATNQTSEAEEPRFGHGKCELAARLAEFNERVVEVERYRQGTSGEQPFDFEALETVKSAIALDPGDPATAGHYPQCAALAVAGGGPMQLLQQTTDAWPLKQGETLQIAFAGGIPPYKATLVGSSTLSRVIATSPTGLGYILYITSQKDTAKGQYVILLSDTSGATRIVEVKVDD